MSLNSTPMPPSTSGGIRRRQLLAALVVTIAVGAASRRLHLHAWLWDKSLGDALYAVATYLVIGLAAPRWKAGRAALVAFCFCLAIELFQATGIPARHAHLAVVRWLVGTQFAWHDIACYVAGIAVIALIDMQMLTRSCSAVS